MRAVCRVEIYENFLMRLEISRAYGQNFLKRAYGQNVLECQIRMFHIKYIFEHGKIARTSVCAFHEVSQAT